MDQHIPPSLAPVPEKVVQAVATAYGLTITAAPPSLLGGATNDVRRVSTRLGDVVLRVHRPETSRDRLLAVHQIQDRLRAAGLPIPAILRARDGASTVVVDGRLVEVLAYVAGGHEVATWGDGAAIMAELGRLHAALRTVDGRTLPAPVTTCSLTPEEALAVLPITDAGFRAQAHDPAYPRAAGMRAATTALVHDLAGARRVYAEALPRIVCHGDFVGNNVLVTDGRVVAILDFDRLAVGDRVVEVARTLMYILSRVVYPRFGGPITAKRLAESDLLALAQLIDRYSAAAGWRLTPTELGALPFEMAGSPLYPIVMAGSEPREAVMETLIFAPHVPMGRWLVDHAAWVSATLRSANAVD